MSSRTAFRRKVVLPITIIRRAGQDRLLAHTLDLTETSARVGGLAALLEPGEVVDVQRGGVKAKFQVFWMGAPSSAMAGQAGIRSLEPGKAIWGVTLPTDAPDLTLDTDRLRDSLTPVRNSGLFPGENRWNPRYLCGGAASVKQQDVSYPVHAEVKDFSRGGIYLEMSTPLLVGTQVLVTVNIEEISFTAAGTVRTSYPLVGMGIAFTNLSSQNQEKIAQIIDKIQQKASAEVELSSDSQAETLPEDSPEISEATAPRLRWTSNPLRELAAACETLASDCDRWKAAARPHEIQELRDALSLLQHKLSAAGPEIELLDFYSVTGSNNMH
jgi:hypothetical protein